MAQLTREQLDIAEIGLRKLRSLTDITPSELEAIKHFLRQVEIERLKQGTR